MLEPNWHALRQSLRRASTLDEVVGAHGDFLDTCLKECLLTAPGVIRVLEKLMSICVLFSAYSDKMVRAAPNK